MKLAVVVVLCEEVGGERGGFIQPVLCKTGANWASGSALWCCFILFGPIRLDKQR